MAAHSKGGGGPMRGMEQTCDLRANERPRKKTAPYGAQPRTHGGTEKQNDGHGVSMTELAQ